MSQTTDATLQTMRAPHQALPWLVAMAFFMQALDSTILNTALPAIASDLLRSPLQMQSAVISYALTVALLIPLSGWLADRYGSRRVFILAVALFSIGSLLCALSSSLPMLVAMRVLQGVGGALMMPVARLTLLRSYPRSDFLAVMSLVTMPGLIGPVLGPLLGGWLVTVASWHWIFLINLPIGVVGIMMALQVMPNLTAKSHAFDFIGYALFSLGLVLLSLALDLLGEGVASQRGPLAAGLGGVLLLLAYLRHAARSTHPLFDLGLLKVRSFSIGSFGNVCARLGTGGIPLLLPLMLQVAFGYSANLSGWMLAPVALAALLIKPIVTRWIPRFGYRQSLLVFSVLTAFSVLLISLIRVDTPLLWMLPALMLFGAASSMQMTAMNTLALADLPAKYTSMGNSLLSVAQQLSISFGIAVSSSALHLFHRGSRSLAQSFSVTFVLLAGLTLLSCLIFMRLHPDDGTGLAREG
jgi:EmrB/QacA subfamily drug resistance transporter